MKNDTMKRRLDAVKDLMKTILEDESEKGDKSDYDFMIMILKKGTNELWTRGECRKESIDKMILFLEGIKRRM